MPDHAALDSAIAAGRLAVAPMQYRRKLGRELAAGKNEMAAGGPGQSECLCLDMGAKSHKPCIGAGELPIANDRVWSRHFTRGQVNEDSARPRSFDHGPGGGHIARYDKAVAECAGCISYLGRENQVTAHQ